MQARYDTPYRKLSESELYASFRTAAWKSASGDTRLALLQELENREAKRQGRPAFRVERAEHGTNAQTLGYFNGDAIYVNERFLARWVSPRYAALYTPSNVLDTVIHEGRHAFQRLVADGLLKADHVDPRQKREWAINYAAYIGGSGKDAMRQFALYAFQPIERDARHYAAQELKRIYRHMVRTGGRDERFEQGIQQQMKTKLGEYLLARRLLTQELLDNVEAEISQVLTAKAMMNPELSARLRELNVDLTCDNHGMFDQLRQRLDAPDGRHEFMDGLDDLQLDDFSDLADDGVDDIPADEVFDSGDVLDALFSQLLRTREDKEDFDGRPWLDHPTII